MPLGKKKLMMAHVIGYSRFIMRLEQAMDRHQKQWLTDPVTMPTTTILLA